MTDGLQSREARAYEWIKTMTQSAERFAGSSTERRVAEQVGEWMRGVGARKVVLEPVASAPRSGFVLALHAGVPRNYHRVDDAVEALDMGMVVRAADVGAAVAMAALAPGAIQATRMTAA